MPDPVFFDKSQVFVGVIGAVAGAVTSLSVTLPICTVRSIDEQCRSIFSHMNMTNFQAISHGCSKLQNHVISHCEGKTAFDLGMVALFTFVGASVLPIVVSEIRACYYARKDSSYNTIA